MCKDDHQALSYVKVLSEAHLLQVLMQYCIAIGRAKFVFPFKVML